MSNFRLKMRIQILFLFLFIMPVPSLMAQGCGDNSDITVNVLEIDGSGTIATNISAITLCSDSEWELSAEFSTDETLAIGTDISYEWRILPAMVIPNNTINISDAGTYEITVTYFLENEDDPTMPIMETAVCEVVVTIPAAPIVVTVTNVVNQQCANQNDGSAAVSVDNAEGNVNYMWEGANTTVPTNSSIATNLAPDEYTVVAIDENGCEAMANFTIESTVNPPLTATIDQDATTPTSCNGDNGSATVIADGGDGVYSFAWNGNSNDNAATSNMLHPGDNTVVVTDGNGCTASATVDIGEPLALIFGVVSGSPEPETCYENDGGFSFTIENGTAPFSWVMNDTLQGMGTVVSGLTGVSNQTITVTDADGCTVTFNGLDINEDKTSPDLSDITATNDGIITCQIDEIELSIIATATDNSMLDYVWEGPGIVSQNGATAVVNKDGQYHVTVMQSINGCSDTKSITVNAEGLPTIEIISTADTLNCDIEEITLEAVVEGNGDFEYAWSTNSTESSITVTESDTFTVYISVGTCDSIPAGKRIVQYLQEPDVIEDITIPGCAPQGSNVTFGNPIADITTEPSGSISVTYFDENDEPITFPLTPNNDTTNITAQVTLFNSRCSSESQITLIVVPFDPPQISTISNFCNNQVITISPTPSFYDYTWAGLNDEQLEIGDDSTCFALNLAEINTNTLQLNYSLGANCMDNMSVEFNTASSTTDAKVFQFANTNVLFCNRNDFDSYQWGREHRDTLCPEPDLGGIGIFQDYVVPGGIKTDEYYYWVIVEQDGCTNKIYLENNAPFGKLVQDPNIEYGDIAMQINPNPNNGAFELTITGDETRALDVHVYDALGRMIHHQDAFKEYGIQTYYVAVPRLTQGIYFVRVTGNDGILLTEKIIVK